MSTLNQDSPRASLVEQRSIDYIPESERHGRLFSQFTLWFGANLQVTAIVTGALAVVLGGDVFWSLIGLLIGQVLGGTIMALHAAQGPKLGLPQMISSRVQFGVYGAVIPIVLVCLMYVGFSASGSVLCALHRCGSSSRACTGSVGPRCAPLSSVPVSTMSMRWPRRSSRIRTSRR